MSQAVCSYLLQAAGTEPLYLQHSAVLMGSSGLAHPRGCLSQLSGSNAALRTSTLAPAGAHESPFPAVLSPFLLHLVDTKQEAFYVDKVTQRRELQMCCILSTGDLWTGFLVSVLFLPHDPVSPRK